MSCQWLEVKEPKQISQYGKAFCMYINSKHRHFKTNGAIVCSDFVCYPFYIGDEPEIIHSDYFEEKIFSILIDHGINLKDYKFLRLYHNNALYVIKPKHIKYWTFYQADKVSCDVFAYLLKQGY